MSKWIASVAIGALNAGLVTALNFKALCPPESKTFALVSVAAATVGFVAALVKSPLSKDGQ